MDLRCLRTMRGHRSESSGCGLCTLDEMIVWSIDGREMLVYQVVRYLEQTLVGLVDGWLNVGRSVVAGLFVVLRRRRRSSVIDWRFASIHTMPSGAC